jgi:hypothetical protein
LAGVGGPNTAAAAAATGPVLPVMMVWNLRGRLRQHFIPARPIVVDCFLNTCNTAETFAER